MPHTLCKQASKRERERAREPPFAQTPCKQASKRERERERERGEKKENEKEKENKHVVGVAAGSEFLALSLCRSLRSLVHFTIKLRAVYCVLLIARWLVAWHMFQ